MALEHRDRAIAHGSNIAPVYAVRGDPVTGKMQPNAPGISERIQPAGVFSTAGYKPSSKSDLFAQLDEEIDKAHQSVAKLCEFPDKPCRGFATSTGYCAGHNKTMKLRGEL